MPRALHFLALVVPLAGCRPALPAVDPCSAEIVRLEGLRSQEILGACRGQTFDECAPVIDRINEKYAPLILAQVRCGAAE